MEIYELKSSSRVGSPSKLAPNWLHKSEQPIRSQVSKLTQLLTLTTTHKFPPQDGSAAAAAALLLQEPPPSPTISYGGGDGGWRSSSATAAAADTEKMLNNLSEFKGSRI